MDKTDLLVQFFQKTEADERLLRARYPQLYTLLSYGVPAVVVKNYNRARDELQTRMDFAVDLVRRHADPTVGYPLSLPRASTVLNPPGGVLTDVFAAAQRVPIEDVPDSTMLYLKDLDIEAPSRFPQTSELGVLDPATLSLITWGVIAIGTIIIGGWVIPRIVKSITGEDLQMAAQAVEMERQQNFSRIWDDGMKVMQQCVGPSPTAAQVTACWKNVMEKVPAIAKAVPDHKMPTGSGIFDKLLWVAGVGALGFAGYLGVSYVLDQRRTKKIEQREEEREARASGRHPAAETAGW